jgi:hypothetical protein
MEVGSSTSIVMMVSFEEVIMPLSDSILILIKASGVEIELTFKSFNVIRPDV